MGRDTLRRYTDLNALIYLLKKRVITMLEPRMWPDTNDSYCLSVHKNNNNLKTLLALCVTKSPEKYHHWHVFANGQSGVCISLKYEEFKDHVSKITGVTFKPVDYEMVENFKNLVDSNLSIDLPYIKRHGFKDEKEYRLIYEDRINVFDTKDIPIPLSLIDHIEINPWVPESLYQSTKELLHSIDGVDGIKITHSSLIDNKKWKNLALRCSTDGALINEV